MTDSQLEQQIRDARAFLVEKLGYGPEVRVIFDHIYSLETKVENLEFQVTELMYDLAALGGLDND